MCERRDRASARATHTRQANVIAHESSRLSIENIVATLSVERGATAQCVGITVSLLFIKFYIFPRSLLCVARSRTHTHTHVVSADRSMRNAKTGCVAHRRQSTLATTKFQRRLAQLAFAYGVFAANA